MPLFNLDKPKLTSIIVSSLNNTRFSCHMTMQCLANITKFTNPEEYELILIDPDPKYPVRDDYKVLKIDKWLKLKPDPGYTAGMNLGVKESEGDYLVFIQNDVFVHEGWLPSLRQYLETGDCDVVFPDQVPRNRQYVLETYKRNPFDPESMKGGRDAGLLMITRRGFLLTEGWNEKLGFLCDKDFYDRMHKADLRWTDTNKIIITHIMAATNLQLMEEKPKEYDRRMARDAKLLND